MSGFKENAHLYWDRDLRIVPIQPGTKRPAADMGGWQGNLASVPNADKRIRWLNSYGEYGVGLLLGSEVVDGRIIVGIDIDDDRLVRTVMAFFGFDDAAPPYTLAGKRGSKGRTIFALGPKNPALKSTVIKGGGGLGNIDLLSTGRQTVMPPHVHPETLDPYTTIGVPITEVEFDRLPEITLREVNILKAAFETEYAVTLIGGEDTHDAGVALTAILVGAGATDPEITSLISGLVPENYTGNSLEELPGWIKSARAKGFDSKSDNKRPNAVAALIGIGAGTDVELCHDGSDTAFATVPAEGGTVTLRIGGASYRRWLRNRAYKTLAQHVTTPQLLEAVAAIESMALHDGIRTSVHNRIAGDDGVVEIDLGAKDGKTVRITSDGWAIAGRATHKFVRGSGFGELPEPVPGGDLSELRSLLGLNEANFHLLLAFLVNALNPNGPYLILLVEGSQGSGKTFFCRTVKMIIDPNQAAKLRLPDNDRDLMIHAKEFRLLNYDNASGMKADISDALCSLATGGGIAVRKLYSDGELHVMSFCRSFVINGISGYAKRPDLMERAIPIRLQSMPDGTRKTEGEMLAAFEEMLPRILGALYSAVAAALRNYGSVLPPTQLRMTDAGQWILASEEGLGVEPGAMIEAISGAQTDLMIERVNDEPVFIRLRAITAGKAFEGYMGDLFARLADERDLSLPKTPAALSQLLDRLAPAMAKAGILVEFFPKDRKGRRVRITSDGIATGKSVPF